MTEAGRGCQAGGRQDAAIRQECALSSDIMKARKLRLEAQKANTGECFIGELR